MSRLGQPWGGSWAPLGFPLPSSVRGFADCAVSSNCFSLSGSGSLSLVGLPTHKAPRLSLVFHRARFYFFVLVHLPLRVSGSLFLLSWSFLCAFGFAPLSGSMARQPVSFRSSRPWFAPLWMTAMPRLPVIPSMFSRPAGLCVFIIISFYVRFRPSCAIFACTWVCGFFFLHLVRWCCLFSWDQRCTFNMAAASLTRWGHRVFRTLLFYGHSLRRGAGVLGR